jgi:hypothetical protein
MGSVVLIYIPSFIKIGPAIQTLIKGIHRHVDTQIHTRSKVISQAHSHFLKIRKADWKSRKWERWSEEENIVTCGGGGIGVTNNNGSLSDDWIYWRLLCIISLNYKPFSAIADLRVHTFQFTAANALGFPVSTGKGSQHRNFHFRSLWSLLVVSSSIPLECRPNSPVLSLQSLYCTVLICTH